MRSRASSSGGSFESWLDSECEDRVTLECQVLDRRMIT